MFKSKIVLWAVAALLAVPAVPMFGSTLHHRLVTRTHTHRLVRRHRLTSRTHRRVTLSAHRKLSAHHRLSHRLAHRSALRHSSMTTSHYKVHVTRMPPTIDGINT